MRIGIDVHVLNGPPQGTASVWLNLLPHLPPTHEYRLYSFDPALTERLFPGRHFVHCRIPVRQPHVRIQLVYPWLARRDRCDAFHVNYFGPWLGAPGLIVTVQDVIYLDFPDYAPDGARMRMRWAGLLSSRAARCVTTASEYSKQRIMERFGVPEGKITVVPNALSREWIEPAPVRAGPRIPGRYLLTVGRLDPRKSFPLAARVTRELKREGLVDGLVVVGPDDFGADAIRAEWRADGTADLVTHLQGLDVAELQALYAGARCVLCLSLAEGFGMPLLEAMAMGTPVVASNRTALPEIAGDAARLVDPADEPGVVRAVRDVLTNDTLGAELIARGRERVRLYEGSKVAKRMVEVYEGAADPGPAARGQRPGVSG